FELLPVCNLHCKMCYVRKSMAEVNRMGGLIPAGQWLDWARQARDAGMLFPLLTGGEPFVRQDFQEIMVGMQEMGLQVSINSNGTLIDESMAKWLGQHRPTRINITLYGASEESYQALCGDGDAFNRVHRAVEWLKQYGVPVKFNTSITPENLNDLEAMICYAKSVGSPIQAATYMFPPVRRDNTMIGQNHRLSPEEAALARVEADFLQNEPAWFLGQAERYRYFVPITEKMRQNQTEAQPQKMHCRAGRCSFWIDWQGNIGNCGMYTSAKVPLAGHSFEEAWRQVVEQTNQIRYSPVCTNCPNYHLCHACIAMVYNESGDCNGYPEYLCKMNEAAARYYQEYAKKLPEEIRSQETVRMKNSFDCDLDEF
ncbi:MAG: radical SAM protein, partial [Lachnospiraceae bacterium]